MFACMSRLRRFRTRLCQLDLVFPEDCARELVAWDWVSRRGHLSLAILYSLLQNTREPAAVSVLSAFWTGDVFISFALLVVTGLLLPGLFLIGPPFVAHICVVAIAFAVFFSFQPLT